MKDEKGSFTPASFAYSYKLSSVLNSGKGNQWYGFAVQTEGPVQSAELYARAKDFHDSLSQQNK
jgi:hypothetical protein